MRTLIIILTCFLFVLFTDAQVNSRGLLNNTMRNSEGFLNLSCGSYYCSGDAYGSFMQNNFWNGKNYSSSLEYEKIWKNNFGYIILLQHSTLFSDDDSHSHGIGRFSSNSTLYNLNLCGEYLVRLGSGHGRKFPQNSFSAFLGGGYAVGNVSFNPNGHVGLSDFRTFLIPAGLSYKFRSDSNLTFGLKLELVYCFSDAIDGYIPQKTLTAYNDVIGGCLFSIGYRLY